MGANVGGERGPPRSDRKEEREHRNGHGHWGMVRMRCDVGEGGRNGVDAGIAPLNLGRRRRVGRMMRRDRGMVVRGRTVVMIRVVVVAVRVDVLQR